MVTEFSKPFNSGNQAIQVKGKYGTCHLQKTEYMAFSEMCESEEIRSAG